MAGYQPMKITGMQTGLVQEREEFILPNDAYPSLTNAYVWRERIKRKQGYELLGRLQRNLAAAALPAFSAGGAGTVVVNIFTLLGLAATEPNASFFISSASNPFHIAIGAPINQSLIDTAGTGTLTVVGAGPIDAASISYATGNVSIHFTGAAGASPTTITASYYPGLPVMGIRIREEQDSTIDQTVFWDTKYAYIYDGGTNQFTEFLPGTTWTGDDSEFFWTTNYFVGTGNRKIFWSTNNSASGDPIRYTNGQAATNWIDFTPQINAAGDTLDQALCLLPFRSRLVAFNTTETDGIHTNRIRWCAIGNPFTVVSAIVATVNPDAWRDDIRGKGGFLDIPTSEDIISVGFVRDNLVIYCERSTWQLRYTGRTIAPFQIEKVNSEIGATGTFSTIQFDTSLLGIGVKGIVECDSYKSERIDIKIPDLVFEINIENNGFRRVHGIRDFINRLAYWTYPSADNDDGVGGTYPDSRLVYNYENDSWAIFTDSLTTLGNFQPPNSRTWLNTHVPWVQCNFTWVSSPAEIPNIVGGNQQGFVETLDKLTTNDPSLFISNITADGINPTVVTSPNHNMKTDFVIKITGIISTDPFVSLNDGIFGIFVVDDNSFQLMTYDADTDEFSEPQVNASGTYTGGGVISIRDNFNIVSKKFSFIDEGQSIQLGYIDILTKAEEDGAFSMNVLLDYNTDAPSNTLDQNETLAGTPDEFFNQIIPTSRASSNGILDSEKYWQRVFCPTRANFLTIEYTFNNAQMAGIEQTLDVQIDAQILWTRRGGRLTQI